MIRLCALHLGPAIISGVLFSLGVGMFAYAAGWRRAVRRHWRMLNKAGSRFTNEDHIQ